MRTLDRLPETTVWIIFNSLAEAAVVPHCSQAPREMVPDGGRGAGRPAALRNWWRAALTIPRRSSLRGGYRTHVAVNPQYGLG